MIDKAPPNWLHLNSILFTYNFEHDCNEKRYANYWLKQARSRY